MTFNPTLHPRGAKGTANGGQFAAGSGGPAKGATAPSPAAAAGGHASGSLTKTLAYDPHSKRGPGYGVKGGDPHVRQLQEALNRLGATDSNGKRLGEDGDLGPLTTSAVERAQKALGLRADGKVTPSLLAALLRAKSLPGLKPMPAAAHKPAPHMPSHQPPAKPTTKNTPTPTGKVNVVYVKPSSAGLTHASARSTDAAMPPDGAMTEADMEQHLADLLSGLTADELDELAALAEAMHADGGN